MALLTVQKLKMEFAETVLFESADFFIEKSERVGIVGINGAGKTTLFKLIKGEIEPTDGAVIKSKDTVLGYMEQHACHGSQKSLYDETCEIFRELMDIEAELEVVTEKLMTDSSDELIAKQQSLQEYFQANGGLTYKSRVRSTLIGLGFSENDFSLSCQKLSGGQRSKLSLAKLLLSNANLLLLDEPTNHLDISSVEWLEAYLKDFNGAVLIISHDRYFLDKVTDKTLEINQKKVKLWNGSYSKYIKSREEQRAIEQHHYETAVEDIKRVEGIIAQQRQFNREKSIKAAENWEKKLEKMKEELVVPDRENDVLRFNFNIKAVSGNDVLKATALSKSFGSKKLFENVSFEIQRQDRVFMLGANGCGKTTLLKILTSDYEADSGTKQFGSAVMLGYFEQTLEKLNDNKTVLDEVWDSYRSMTSTVIRNALAAFLFKGEEVFKKVGTLSGGEKARVALLKLMLSGANFLLLDEPTNHLDISSREALENALMDYEGTILAVSHDRYFINKLATRIMCLEENGVRNFAGNYDYYFEHVKNAPQQVKEAEKPKVNEYKLKKEKESELRRKKGRLSRLENEISEIEEEIKNIENELNLPETTSDYELVLKLTNELDEKNNKLEEMLEEWEELMSSIE
ncbi:MAG: ABC-F family ATP-binding cassette domain-containing protein [Clostridia bacterium]|nr:ABC-F family ATP-binding cassette domain-containing protein [Clostridia bacterium]